MCFVATPLPVSDVGMVFRLAPSPACDAKLVPWDRGGLGRGKPLVRGFLLWLSGDHDVITSNTVSSTHPS
ncbi:hypothetical protein SAMN05216570_4279, partial [Dyella sp. OK004]